MRCKSEKKRHREKLKKKRKEAHEYFDYIWLYKHYNSGKPAKQWRRKAYRWLAKKMGLSIEDCHFSKFNVDQCIQAIEICSEEFVKNEKLIEFAEKIENREIHGLIWFSNEETKSF